MKKLIIVALFLCNIFAMPVMAQAPKFDKVEVKVEGLGCPFCAFGLEKKVKTLVGIRQIQIDIETGKMTFEIPSENRLTNEQIDAKVDEAGYTAKKIEIHRAGLIHTDAVAENIQVEEPSVNVSLETHTFTVRGSCEMCTSRILRAVEQVKGVSNPAYDLEKQQLTLTFDVTKTNLLQVKQAIAAKGHDTDTVKAEAATYNNLPPCCKYRD